MSKKLFNKRTLFFLIILSLAVSIRQTAMTMVMPFISIYAKSLSHYTPALAAISLGIFGLAQAIFQIPFGILSDKFGEKKIVLIGLFLVIAGLILAGVTSNIYLLITARTLQGSGAIIAVVCSWVSNETNDQNRTRALSIVSSSMSFAAALSFAIGPLIHKFISVNNMFIICAILISFSWICILLFLRNNNEDNTIKETNSTISKKELLTSVLKDKDFMKLNISAFMNNFIMTSVFFILPQYIDNLIGEDNMWKVFIPAVVIAVLVMKLIVPLAEKGYSFSIISSSFLIGTLGILFFIKKNFYTLLIGSIFFMISYICIATISQTKVNEKINNTIRGTVNGVFNSFQYIGSFIGSIFAGTLWSVNINFPIYVNALLSILTFIIILTSLKDEFSQKSKTTI